VLADQPAHAAAKRQSGDTRRGDHTHGGRKPEGLRLAIELTDGEAGFGPHGTRCTIDANTLHGRKIDHEPVVADRLAGNAVTTATHCDGQVVLAGKAHACDHVRRAGAARDDRRTAINDPVEDDASCIVSRLAWRK
jgi:hypothetical protein